MTPDEPSLRDSPDPWFDDPTNRHSASGDARPSERNSTDSYLEHVLAAFYA